ncbi:MAG: CAP domain-containing protein [Acidimicrobiia bacterium]
MKVRQMLALTLGVLVFASTAAVAAASPGAEAEFVAAINQSRSAAGLAPLSVHGDLVAGARAHTAEMIPTGTIFHSTAGQLAAVTTGWAVLGENVGKGPDVSVLHRAFMESPSHKANILGDFDRVGVGVALDADSKMYVTVIFMKSSSPSTTTTTTAPTTTTTTVATTSPTTPPTTTTTTVPASTDVSPGDASAARPSAPAVARDGESIRTLGYELSEERWVDGTFCVTIRSDGAVCVE